MRKGNSSMSEFGSWFNIFVLPLLIDYLRRLRKGLKDLYGAMIGNWPPIECLRDGIPVQGGKGTGMTEVLLARKGLITASVSRTLPLHRVTRIDLK